MSKKLKDRFDLVVNEYVKKFAKKHEIEFDYWIGGDIGEIASFSEYYVFSCYEIRYDIDNDVPKQILFNWYNLRMTDNKGYEISYKNYVLGLRPKDIIESERRESLERSKNERRICKRNFRILFKESK